MKTSRPSSSVTEIRHRDLGAIADLDRQLKLGEGVHSPPRLGLVGDGHPLGNPALRGRHGGLGYQPHGDHRNSGEVGRGEAYSTGEDSPSNSHDRVSAYGRSKLANLLFTYELQQRLSSAEAGTAALAAHPGASSTELARNSPAPIRLLEPLARPLLQSAAMGALPTLRAATDPEAEGGQYYGPGGIAGLRGHPERVESSDRSHDPEIRNRLWSASERLTGVSYPV